MNNNECPYSDQCGIACSQVSDCCQVKELFEDFYNLEKMYFNAQKEIGRLKSELSETIGAIDNVRRAKEKLQEENRKFKEMLRGKINE